MAGFEQGERYTSIIKRYGSVEAVEDGDVHRPQVSRQQLGGQAPGGIVEYQHTQYGIGIIAGVLIAFFGAFLASFMIKPFVIAVVVAVPILAIMLALFYCLNITVNNHHVVCRFGIGLIQKEILLSDIKQIRAVTNPWYVGWGIRWMPGQYWLWNVSGLLAVELLLSNGARFRIGTGEPDVLARAIETNIGGPPNKRLHLTEKSVVGK